MEASTPLHYVVVTCIFINLATLMFITMKEATSSKISPKGIVLNFVQALNAEEFETARACVLENMVFEGVLGTRNGAEAYFNDMRKMRLKYTVFKLFEDAQDACLLCEVTMGGLALFTSIWYQLEGDKIKTIKAVFDPRPALEQ